MVRLAKFQLRKMIRLFEDKSHVEAYVQHRPTWPKEIAEKVINHFKRNSVCLTERTVTEGIKPCSHLVDVGCGSGQSTGIYVPYCDKITALDPSEEQIKSALAANKFENITYQVGVGEKIPVKDESVEIVSCAQSAHWMDWDLYFKECQRILVPHGCMATYGYAFPKITSSDERSTRKCNHLLKAFYQKCRFHQRRRHIDNHFTQLFDALPCSEKTRDESMEIRRQWSLDDFSGYISTWSGYRMLIEEDPSTDILSQLISDIESTSGVTEMIITWSIFLLLSSRPCP